MQDDAVVISPRIDSLDCNDLGPYLPHGLGSVNAMMLGASVSSVDAIETKEPLYVPTSKRIAHGPWTCKTP